MTKNHIKPVDFALQQYLQNIDTKCRKTNVIIKLMSLQVKQAAYFSSIKRKRKMQTLSSVTTILNRKAATV